MAGRRVPMRTCVGCRAIAAKAELLRVVRSAAARLEIDPSGSAPGRGAYVHPDDVCADAATRRGGLTRALGVGFGPDEASNLRDRIRGEQEHT